MWGLAQRHGWGVPKDEATGFRWLRRAAELAVADLEKGKQGDMSAVRVSVLVFVFVFVRAGVADAILGSLS